MPDDVVLNLLCRKSVVGDIILITGGVKSGKSSFALTCGEAKGNERAFVATATALDDEMARKISAHREERKDRWKTFEEPRDIAGVIEKIGGVFDVVLVDCLTMWVSNLLTLYNMTSDGILTEFEKLQKALADVPAEVVLVTNEVGLGIMPGDKLSRAYQHLLGLLNKEMAKAATGLYLMVAGFPLKIK